MMKRSLLFLLIACVAISCSSASSLTPATAAPDRWLIEIIGTDRRPVGRVVLQLTNGPVSSSCVGVPGMVYARVIEQEGLDRFEVRDQAAISVQGRRLYADLSLGMCDHNLTISGTITGSRASGTAGHSTYAGTFNVGRFTARKLPPLPQ